MQNQRERQITVITARLDMQSRDADQEDRWLEGRCVVAPWAQYWGIVVNLRGGVRHLALSLAEFAGAGTDTFMDNCLDNPKAMALEVLTKVLEK
jgi:hypothetical protein